MDKMQYPRGLIRYTSEHELAGGKTHWLRPRIIGYVLVLSVMVGVFSYNIITRVPVEFTAIRDRNQLFLTTDGGAIENIYTLQLANMDNDPHEFNIGILGIPGATIVGETRHTLEGGEVRSITLRVSVDPGQLTRPSTELDFTAVSPDSPSLKATAESRFMKPL
jgi:polyferredoxin